MMQTVASTMAGESRITGKARYGCRNRMGFEQKFQAAISKENLATGGISVAKEMAAGEEKSGTYLNPAEFMRAMIEQQYGSVEKYKSAISYHQTVEGAGSMAKSHPIIDLPASSDVTQSQAKRLEYVQKRFADYEGDGSAQSLMEYYINKYVTDQQKEIMAAGNVPGKFMSPCQASSFSARGRHESWASQGLHDPALFLNQYGDPQGNTLYSGSNTDAQVLRNMIRGALRTELGYTVTQNKFIGDPFAKGLADDMNFEGHRISAEEYISQLAELGRDYSWIKNPLSLAA